MRIGLVVAVLAVVPSFACAPDDGPPVASSEHAVVGGTADTGDPSAVGILLLDSAENIVGTCSGTLITPRVVLTAGHCVGPDSGASKWAVYFGSTFNWLFEASPGSPTSEDPSYLGLVYASAATTHPGYTASPELRNDIALIQIEGTGPTTPTQIARTNPFDGQAVKLVGFGNNIGGTTASPDGAGSGDKRLGNSTITEVYSDVIIYGTTGVNTCQGDSGGPNYVTEGGVTVVAGVTSFGDGIDGAGDSSCSDYGAGTNVASFQDFIDGWVRDHDTVTCADDGACATGCAAIDSDCPCADDGFCTAACGVVDGDPDCPRGCRQNGTCVEGCPLGEDPDCNPEACAANGVCNASCESDPDCGAASLPTGAACHSGAQCQSGQCIAVAGDPGTLYCTGSCDPSVNECPNRMYCAETEGGGGTCIYDTPPDGGVGAPCGGAGGVCNSGSCLEGLDVCTAPCDGSEGSCPFDFVCEALDDGNLYCLPPVDGGDGDGGGGGGCSTVPGGGAGGAGGAALVLCALALLLVRKMRLVR